jgi:hypothetical protein
VGKYKDEKNRQGKRAAAKAAKANEGIATSCAMEATQGIQTLDESTTGQVDSAQTSPAQDVQGTVALVASVGGMVSDTM